MSIPNNLSTKMSTDSQAIKSKWDDTIKDAEEEIENLAKQKRRLQQAVRIFKANKRDGVPWPEQQKSPQEGG